MLSDAISGAVSGLAKPLFDLIDNLFTSDDERDRAKLALMKLEQDGRLEAFKASVAVAQAEASSQDRFTSRARPAFLYVFYGILILFTLFSMAGGILSVWYPAQVTTAADATLHLIDATFGAVPDWMFGAFTASYAVYAGARSVDKWKGRK